MEEGKKRLIKKGSGAAALILFLMLSGTGMGSAGMMFSLEVKDYRNDRPLLHLKIAAREEISLSTIHSLALTPYTHIYKFDEKGNLILAGAVYESGGGGFPDSSDGVLSVVDGKFHMDRINRFVGKLRFRVSPVSRETLIISKREFPLYRMVPEGTLLELSVTPERSPF